MKLYNFKKKARLTLGLSFEEELGEEKIDKEQGAQLLRID